MCLSPISLTTPKGRISVPCGKCPECLQKRRSEWTFRLMQELKTVNSAYFITFTYRDEDLPVYNYKTLQVERVSGKECKFIPENYGVNEDTGEINHKERFNLVLKDDIQRFIKRLRKENLEYSKNQIRYYITNEYGEHTNRTHYHSIMFNVNTKVLLSMDLIWGYGNIKIGDVTQQSIHYCTKYMLVPEGELKGFALMSRRPFIGSSYVNDKMVKYHRTNNMSYVSHQEGQKIAIPRTIKKKIFPGMVKKQFKRLKFDYYVPSKEIVYESEMIKLKQEKEAKDGKKIERSKNKKLSFIENERINDKEKYRKMVKQSKSKKV